MATQTKVQLKVRPYSGNGGVRVRGNEEGGKLGNWRRPHEMRNPRTKALFFRVERTVPVQVFNCALLHIVPKSVNLGYQRYLRRRPSVRIRKIHACISACKAAWHQLKKISFCCYCF